jgi:release factor glutamine methyltransferase
VTSVGELLRECEAALPPGKASGSDAREILAALLDVPRFWPASHGEETVALSVRERVARAAALRSAGAPLQYASGKAAFRHLTLAVNRSVLIPRPETELLVDIVLGRGKQPGGTVVDIGTGSGAIAIALATEGKFDRIIATDISSEALEVARVNAETADARIELRAGSLLEPIAGEQFDVVVSNPPYIAEAEMQDLPEEVRDWEPRAALCSGPDGLDAIRALVAGAPGILVNGGLMALEVDSRRADLAADILRADGRYESIEILPDLTGRPRFVVANRRS